MGRMIFFFLCLTNDFIRHVPFKNGRKGKLWNLQLSRITLFVKIIGCLNFPHRRCPLDHMFYIPGRNTWSTENKKCAFAHELTTCVILYFAIYSIIFILLYLSFHVYLLFTIFIILLLYLLLYLLFHLTLGVPVCWLMGPMGKWKATPSWSWFWNLSYTVFIWKMDFRDSVPVKRPWGLLGRVN